jgi:hypothetical protein
LDGIAFRSDLFSDGQYLRYQSGQIVTGPGGGGGGGAFPTKPFRVTDAGVVEYDSIQAAIDAASPDDLIYVPAPPSGISSYNEQVVINKQVNLVAIGGKRCRITYSTGPVITVTSRCRITGFWVEAESGPAIRFAPGSEYAILDETETDEVEIVIDTGYVYFNRVRCYSLVIQSSSTGTILYASFCYIDTITGGSSPSTVVLNDSYLTSFSGSITVHHSGGSPANFPPSEAYRNYNIPWAPTADSLLVYRTLSGYWQPEPLSSVASEGFPTKPFRIISGEVVQYDTIQEAINSLSGGTVYVPPGTYNEQIVISNNVTLAGLTPDAVFISHDGPDPVITVSGGVVYLLNLHIIGVGYPRILLTGAADMHLSHVRCGRLRMEGSSTLECQWCEFHLIESQDQSGEVIRTSHSRIQLLALDGGSATLDDTYLGGVAGFGTVRHSGGSPGNFIPETLPDYQNWNIPYAPLEPSVLAYLTDRWLPLAIDDIAPGGPHHQTHEQGGVDEINVGGLAGRLADYQKADQIGPWSVDVQTTPDVGNVLMWDGAQITWGTVQCEAIAHSMDLPIGPADPGTPASTLQVSLSQSNVPV